MKDLEYKNAYSSVDEFFENLYNNGDEGVILKGIKFTYREVQHTYALNVMECLRDKSILLIQAGVGTGKSMGYLIPIFETINNVSKFKKVLISTSSIALQQQLLTDIDSLKKVLGIRPKVEILKGIKNYACLYRIEELLKNGKIGEKIKDNLEQLVREMKEKRSADREDLLELSDKVWNQVKLKNRGFCSGCSYASTCYYNINQERISEANIIITNHAYLSYLMRMREELLKNGKGDNLLDKVDAIVVDEAHNLEDNVRVQKELRFEDIKHLISDIRRGLGGDYTIGRGLVNKIKAFFETVERSSNAWILEQNSVRKINYDIAKFVLNDEIKNSIKVLIGTKEVPGDLVKFRMAVLKKLNTISDYNVGNNLRELDGWIRHFIDILKGSKSESIYYTVYYWDSKEKIKNIKIGYKAKNIKDTMASIYDRDIPIIFTSGTLTDINGNYEYTKDRLTLKDRPRNKKVEDSEILDSPYDFENNSLVYYNPSIPNPKNRNNSILDNLNYLNSLALEIDKLIRITNGKSLILFTSKEDMVAVYNILKGYDYPFSLLLGDGNLDVVKNKFKDEVDSCLFATGAFWEGIDIKGSSLSNLIICHLPFPVVDPVSEYKASKYSVENRFREVYLNEMVQKLAQGTGRLIRGVDDKGIVCILDSRVEKNLEEIKRVLPFSRYTSNIDDVYEFASLKINKRR